MIELNDYAGQMCTRKIGEISSKVNVRFSEIQRATGLSFPKLFSVESEAVSAVSSSEAGGADFLAAGLQSASGARRSLPFNGELFRSSQDLPSDYDGLIDEISGRYGLDSALVRAVVRAESGFNPNALSGKGAMGLMQLMPATADGLGVTDAFDPAQNIDGGVRALLGHIIRYDGNVPLALAAYNCGQGTISRLGLSDLSAPYEFAQLPGETRDYLNRIYSILSEKGAEGVFTANFFTPPATAF